MKTDDPFQYDRWPAGEYNDYRGWRPWAEGHVGKETPGAVTTDPRKGTGLKQWAQPELELEPTDPPK